MRKLLEPILSLAILCAAGWAVAEENWPCWRGPRGDGSSLADSLPTDWDGARGKNVRFKTPLSGNGYSSPIVWGDWLFFTACDLETQQRNLLCFDAHTGKPLWQRTVITAPLEKKHKLNSFSSGTPATDGEFVYVTFLQADYGRDELPGKSWKEATPGKMVVAAYDFNGDQKWLVRPGPFSSVHGYCSCPVLYQNLVIVNGDHDGDSYIVALERETGKTVWKTPRENRTRSYCTPIIRDIGGRTQMILTGDMCLASYDPATGKRLWKMDGPTEQFVASPVYNGAQLFISAGFPEYHILALQPNEQGRISTGDILWRTTKGCAYVPSPIVLGPYFLVTSDTGIASCFDAKSGERHWMKRMGRHFSASPVSAGGLIYFTDDDGKTTIVRPGETYDVVAENELGELCFASPAVAHGRVYFRGEEHLICIDGSR